jgi:flagellar biosynthesis protein FlhF
MVDDQIQLSHHIPPITGNSKPSTNPQPIKHAFDNTALADEIRNLKLMVQSMSADRTRSKVWVKPHRFSSQRTEEAYSELIMRGLDEGLALTLVSSSEIAAAADEDILSSIVASLSRRISICADVARPTTKGKPDVVALIGPTGVGKTTTVAKIAARAALQEGLKVGLVTLDTFRIAAIEQLKTYAAIMGMPVRVVEDVRQMKVAIDSFSDRDLILIDTTGRSPQELSNEWELAEFMTASTHIRKALVLSATTKQGDLTDIIRRFEVFGTNCLIFTKLDETGTHASMVSELVQSGKPLAYVTVGQSVPQDIIHPDSRQIVELAIGPNPSECWADLLRAARTPEPRAELQATN